MKATIYRNQLTVTPPPTIAKQSERFFIFIYQILHSISIGTESKIAMYLLTKTIQR